MGFHGIIRRICAVQVCEPEWGIMISFRKKGLSDRGGKIKGESEIEH